jgi:transcriptional regulator NrdR family protein
MSEPSTKVFKISQLPEM